MRKPFCVILAAALLLGAPALHAEQKAAEKNTKEKWNWTEAAPAMKMIILSNQVYLYKLCGTYYVRFNRWPSSKRDLAKFVEKYKIKTPETAHAIWQVFEMMYFDFKTLKNGDLLIKGRYRGSIARDFRRAGLGKCLISSIGRRTEEELEFFPTDKAKDNKDFINKTMTIRLKEPAPIKKESAAGIKTEAK